MSEALVCCTLKEQFSKSGRLCAERAMILTKDIGHADLVFSDLGHLGTDLVVHKVASWKAERT
jgi:hypothetical protein